MLGFQNTRAIWIVLCHSGDKWEQKMGTILLQDKTCYSPPGATNIQKWRLRLPLSITSRSKICLTTYKGLNNLFFWQNILLQHIGSLPIAWRAINKWIGSTQLPRLSEEWKLVSHNFYAILKLDPYPNAFVISRTFPLQLKHYPHAMLGQNHSMLGQSHFMVDCTEFWAVPLLPIWWKCAKPWIRRSCWYLQINSKNVKLTFAQNVKV